MTKRYAITDAARAEVAASFGEAFSISILVMVDQCRSHSTFAPVDGAGNVCGHAHPLFSDQVEQR